MQVALLVEAHDGCKRVEYTVVEEPFAQRGVAQRRCLEHSAILRVRAKVVAQRAAEAKVEIAGIGVGRDPWVSRNSERNKPAIRELRKGAALQFAGMTLRTVAPCRVIEHRQPAFLFRGQPDFSAQVRIVLAAVRIKTRRVLLKGFERHEDSLPRKRRIVEHRSAECRLEQWRVHRRPEPRNDRSAVGVRHFKWRKERRARLLVRGLGAAVPVQAPCWSLIGAVVVIVVGEVFAEWRSILLVAQGGHRAHTRHAEVGAAELDRTIIRWTPGVRRVVTARTGHTPRRGERRVEKEPASQCGEFGGVRLSLECARIECGRRGARRHALRQAARCGIRGSSAGQDAERQRHGACPWFEWRPYGAYTSWHRLSAVRPRRPQL